MWEEVEGIFVTARVIATKLNRNSLGFTGVQDEKRKLLASIDFEI